METDSPRTSLLSLESPTNELISLNEAAKLLPRIDGKKVAVVTLWRWCRRGLRGEHLEYTRVGRKICTTHGALLRFFNRLAELDELIPPSRPATLKRAPISSSQRQRSLAEADAVLKRAGI